MKSPSNVISYDHISHSAAIAPLSLLLAAHTQWDQARIFAVLPANGTNLNKYIAMVRKMYHVCCKQTRTKAIGFLQPQSRIWDQTKVVDAISLGIFSRF